MTMHSLVVRLLMGSFFLWAMSGCSHLPESYMVRSDIDINETANYITLTPNRGSIEETGLLFYPGALVTPHAYIPALQQLAGRGYAVVILKVNANLAISNIGKAAQYRSAVPAARRWVLGGHSLGGAVACRDIQRNPDLYKGLILWASFPGDAASIADWQGAVLSIWAERDLLTEEAAIEDNKANMPPAQVVDLANFPTQPTNGTTLYYEIEGGNHAQFGDYGPQNGDGEATISRATQQMLINDAMQQFYSANQW